MQTTQSGITASWKRESNNSNPGQKRIPAAIRENEEELLPKWIKRTLRVRIGQPHYSRRPMRSELGFHICRALLHGKNGRNPVYKKSGGHQCDDVSPNVYKAHTKRRLWLDKEYRVQERRPLTIAFFIA